METVSIVLNFDCYFCYGTFYFAVLTTNFYSNVEADPCYTYRTGTWPTMVPGA